MKILHIGNLKSGIDTYVRNTVAKVGDSFEYVIVNGADDNSEPYLRHGHAIKQYQICMYRTLNPIKDFKAIVQTIKIIKKEKPDLVHCHSAKGGVIGRIAAFLTDTKSIYTPHAFSFLSSGNKKKKLVFLFLERIAKLNSNLLACSYSESELGIRTVHYKKNRVFVWPNSIPSIQPTDIQEPKSLDPNMKYIISIGRPSYQKNPLLMVEIMKNVHQIYPDIHFLLVGVGFYSPMLKDMKRLIGNYHLDHFFHLIPWCSHEETLGYLQYALFYLTTSLYEGLPIAVLEAMAMGKAIIASNVIGNKDCVKNGYNGFLLSMDEKLFGGKCCELIKDEETRKKMELNSKTYFESNFLIDKNIKKLEEIYLKV
jgi:glycosyltransferase involved in cell wall biosynthesis